MTVLIAVSAATIAVVTARLAMGTLSGEQERVSSARALESASAIRSRVEAALEQDPLAMYYKVLDDEAPRVCSELNVVIEPGSAWPEECGSYWTYDTEGLTDGALITPPSGENGRLVLVSFSVRAGQEVALRDEYTIGGLQRPLLYSGASLNLAQLRSGGAQAAVTGPVYAAGPLDLRSVDLAGAPLVATESAFVTAPGTVGPVYAAAAASPDPAVHDVRFVYATPLPATALQSSITALSGMACLDPNPVNHGSVSSGLCLRSGANVVTSNDVSVTVPSSAAYLLVPAASAPGTVDVYRVSELPDQLPGEGCAAPCALSGLDAAVAHPGKLSFWGAKLGTFNFPASGVIATDAPTFVGLCGVGTADGGCIDWAGSAPGAATVDTPFTVVAGDPANPVDVYLSGSLHGDADTRATLIASGDLVVPYWAASDTAARFDVVAIAAGAGQSSLRTVPDVAVTDPREQFSITGGVLLGRFTVAVTAFAAYALDADGQVASNPPPFTPSPALRFDRISERQLSDAELASALAG